VRSPSPWKFIILTDNSLLELVSYLVRRFARNEVISYTRLFVGFVVGLEIHLSKSPFSGDGPYTLGPHISYADFMVWQIYHDERSMNSQVDQLLASSAPRLKQLVEAVAARPNVKAYHNSD
jgi:hypothetical protein